MVTADSVRGYSFRALDMNQWAGRDHMGIGARSEGRDSGDVDVPVCARRWPFLVIAEVLRGVTGFLHASQFDY